MNLTNQYIELAEDVLTNGETTQGRNSETRMLWSPQPLVVNDVYKNFPLLQDRAQPLYTSVLETMYFLSGDTSFAGMPKVLRDSFWKPWAQNAERHGSFGRFYPAQWRAQRAEFGFYDALKGLIKELEEVKNTGLENRKMAVSLWNKPDNDPTMTRDVACLDSCHSTSLVFNLSQRAGVWKLDLHHTQRSLDICCGLGPDLIYSGLLMNLLCQEVGALPGKLVFAPVNVHIYKSHIPQFHQHILDTPFVEEQPVTLQLAANAIWRKPMTIPEARTLCNFINVPEGLPRVKFQVVM